MLVPVILSGGSGTRLWPLSREMYPKQLLALTGEQTLLQQTVCRVKEFDSVEARPGIVVCNEEHRFLVAEQLKAAGIATTAIILEPGGKNTAPATAVAAIKAQCLAPDAMLLVLPADHLIADSRAFQQAVLAGLPLAAEGRLITFGIRPHTPETGYGYIRLGERLNGSGENGEVCAVAQFVEKPDLGTATKYLESGEYLWNSGMFLFRADVFLEELGRYAPEMVAACREAFDKRYQDLDFLRLDRQSFAACPSDSIDYALFEKTDRAAVVPVDPGWSDIGSWAALWEVGKKDRFGNVTKGDILAFKTNDSYIHAENRLVATVGVTDHIIVETADAVLVAHKDHVQEVKAIVNRLKSSGRSEASLHRRVFRPWGNYEGISTGDRYQVKRIIVYPGAVLSLQLHHHRAEHWIVVKGTAEITRGEETFMLTENQSTYIPLGVMHRLANPGVIPLELIEVQSGSYLGEDDIVRYSDNYGRAGNNDNKNGKK